MLIYVHPAFKWTCSILVSISLQRTSSFRNNLNLILLAISVGCCTGSNLGETCRACITYGARVRYRNCIPIETCSGSVTFKNSCSTMNVHSEHTLTSAPLGMTPNASLHLPIEAKPQWKKKKKKKNNSVPLICSCRRSTRGVFITLKTNFPFYICSCFSFRLSNRFCLYLSSPLKSSALMFDPFSQQKRLLNVRARTSGLSSRKWVRFSVQLQMNLRYGYNAGKFQTHFCPTYWSFLLN